MPFNPESLENLQPIPARPVGSKRRAGDYWQVKLPNGKWRYTHKALAEELLGRPLRPNERVYFTEEAKLKPDYKLNPQPGDIEVRIVVPTNGTTPGKRRKLIRRILQTEHDLELMKLKLAEINTFYNKAPDDRKDAGIPVDWQPRPPRPLSGLD